VIISKNAQPIIFRFSIKNWTSCGSKKARPLLILVLQIRQSLLPRSQVAHNWGSGCSRRCTASAGILTEPRILTLDSCLSRNIRLRVAIEILRCLHAVCLSRTGVSGMHEPAWSLLSTARNCSAVKSGKCGSSSPTIAATTWSGTIVIALVLGCSIGCVAVLVMSYHTTTFIESQHISLQHDTYNNADNYKCVLRNYKQTSGSYVAVGKKTAWSIMCQAKGSRQEDDRLPSSSAIASSTTVRQLSSSAARRMVSAWSWTLTMVPSVRSDGMFSVRAFLSSARCGRK
jgi:hypothetical protein